tara:strand:- start:362 stop:499 length:138 start_codon:yes stop_codon:yes gene_type:complete
VSFCADLALDRFVQRHFIARYGKIDLFYPLIVRLMQLSLGLFGYE